MFTDVRDLRKVRNTLLKSTVDNLEDKPRSVAPVQTDGKQEELRRERKEAAEALSGRDLTALEAVTAQPRKMDLIPDFCSSYVYVR